MASVKDAERAGPMTYLGKSYHPPGTAPGTLTSSSGSDGGALSIRLIDYTVEAFVEHELASVADCRPFLDQDSKTWIQVNGSPDADTLRSLGEQFGLHDLALEDVVNRGQRPKLDIYEDQLFIVMSLPRYRGDELDIVQVSLFAGEHYLICFYPGEDDPFAPVRKRLRPPNNNRFRTRRIDYLLYALLDLIIDEGFPVLERFGDQIETLEEELLAHPGRDTLAAIHQVRRDLLLLRRMLWPQREVIAGLLRSDQQVIVQDDTHVYLRDCYDHCVQILDLQESFREMSTSLLDVYLSSISNRTNEIMRVLTIIATIFIPLTFIVGIYGMNFAHDDSPWAMPELYWYYGYPMVWGVMLGVTGAMLWFFRRRKWL